MSKYCISADTVLAGKDLASRANYCLAVEGGVILEILPRADAFAKYGEEWQKIELGGLTVLPGMIECHNHLALDGRLVGHLEMMEEEAPKLTILSVNTLRDDLLSGVTTARCMGDRYYIDVICKKEIAAGRILGPNLLTCGTGMRGLHGHGFVGVPHTGPEEFRKTSRENLRRGCDHLKIFITAGAPPQAGCVTPYYLSYEEMRMAVEEGERLGVKVNSHCVGGPGLCEGVRAGVHSFDHLYSVSDDEIELLLKNDRWAGLTSGVYLDPDREPFYAPAKLANAKRCREQIAERMTAVIKSGVKWALGTDAFHTFLWKEVVIARQCGASALDALKGVTANAAELCGIAGKTGSLEAGLCADIIAVRGNPLDDAAWLRDVPFVMKNGKIYKTPE